MLLIRDPIPVDSPRTAADTPGGRLEATIR